MKELTMNEVEQVTGGVAPIVVALWVGRALLMYSAKAY